MPSYTCTVSPPVLDSIAKRHAERLRHALPPARDSALPYLDYGLACLCLEVEGQEKQVNDLTQQICQKIDDQDKATTLALNNIEQRLKSLGISQTAIQKRLDGLEALFDRLEKRFDGLEALFHSIEERLIGLEARLVSLEAAQKARDIQFINSTKYRLHHIISAVPRKKDSRIPPELPKTVKGFLRLARVEHSQNFKLISLLQFYGIDSVSVPTKPEWEWNLDDDEEEFEELDVTNCIFDPSHRQTCMEHLATILGLDYDRICKHAKRLQNYQKKLNPNLGSRKQDDKIQGGERPGGRFKKPRVDLSPATSITSPSGNSVSPWNPEAALPSSSNSTSGVHSSAEFDPTQRMSTDSDS